MEDGKSRPPGLNRGGNAYLVANWLHIGTALKGSSGSTIHADRSLRGVKSPFGDTSTNHDGLCKAEEYGQCEDAKACATKRQHMPFVSNMQAVEQ